MTVFAALWSLVIVSGLGAQAQVPAPAPVPAAIQPDIGSAGRVVVTITVEGLRIPAVTVELERVDAEVAVAETFSDAVGQVTFPDVTPGRYVVRTRRDGFADGNSTPFDVLAGVEAQVLVEMRLTFLRESVDVVVPANSPTESLQPVAVSDVLSGTRMDVQPLTGDDFQSLLTVLPSIMRGPDGRLRIKGGGPTSGALQMSSANLNDPSTGDFDLELPSGAVESVEVLSNPFAAEYGRFSTSVTQVRTKRGTNEWNINPDNLVPGFGRGFGFVSRFEPRLSISGPLKKDRLLLGQYFQYRFARTQVQSLPDRPLLGLDSFDSFTRLDAVLSPRHALTGGAIYFPRKVTNAMLSTFRPPVTSTTFTQEGFSMGFADRLVLSGSMVLESTFAARTFDIDQKAKGTDPMTFAPATQGGHFYNDQDRKVHSIQAVEALTVSKEDWLGQHVFKFGLDFQQSRYTATDENRTIEALRLDDSVAERTTYEQQVASTAVTGTEFALFAQDRWRVTNRLNLEIGFRLDRDAVVERVNYSPRAGASFSVLPEGRGILRGGMGVFNERTPLTVGAFTQFAPRTSQRFDASGAPLGAPVTFVHTIAEPLRTPQGIVQTVSWDQRVARLFFFKVSFLKRNGSRAYVLTPNAESGTLTLSSSGASRYWELETTGRWLARVNRDLSVSYVRSRSTRDLNDYDQFFGNFRNPILRANANALSPTDVPHRVIVRGSIGLPGQWVFSPLYEWRTGFPWSAVNEFQDFVGERNEAGRLPTVSTLDFTIARPIRVLKYRVTAGLKLYNTFGSGSFRDVQANTASPQYGQFYNPIQRSIGFLISTSRP